MTGGWAMCSGLAHAWENVVVGPHRPAGLRSAMLTSQLPMFNHPATRAPDGSIDTLEKLARADVGNGAWTPQGAAVEGRSTLVKSGWLKRRANASPPFDSTICWMEPPPEV